MDTVEICFYNERMQQFERTPRLFQLDPSYINTHCAAARLLLELLGLQISPEDWQSLAYVHNTPFKSALKHVALFSLYIEKVLYVPVPSLICSFALSLPVQSMSVLRERLKIVKPVNLQEAQRFASCAPHQDPDFISVCLKDYSIWAGFNEAVYCGHFQRGADKWNFYYGSQGDIPDIDRMPSLRGIVISGSKYNMTDTSLPWMSGFIDMIRRAYGRPGVKILGICLGHQALAYALGGEIGLNPSGDFIYKLESCEPLRDNLLGRIALPQIHRQCVLRAPACLQVLHRSQTCSIESLYQSRKALSVQGHPELTSHFLRNYYCDFLLRIGSIDSQQYQETCKMFTESEGSVREVLEKMNIFLRDDNY